MIIVRRNKSKPTDITHKNFDVYLKAADGSEHLIEGVVLVKQFQDKLPTSPYHTYVVEIHMNENAVKFE